MKPQLKERIKAWLCKNFGHKDRFSHHFNGDIYVCKRCGRMKKENEKCTLN